MKLYIDNGQFMDDIQVSDEAVRMICAAVALANGEEIEELLIPKHEHDPNTENPLAEMMFNVGRDIETASHANMIVTMDWEIMADANPICKLALKYGIPVMAMRELTKRISDIFMKKGTAMEYEPRAEKDV